MIVKVEDFAQEIYEEFKDKIPNLTKRKVELMLKNSFFCISWHVARLNPIQLEKVGFHPNTYYATLIVNNKWVIPQQNYTLKKKLNQRIKKMNVLLQKKSE